MSETDTDKTVTEQKPEEVKIEEKTEEKLEQKPEEKTEEKTEQKKEEKVEEKTEEKKVEEKVEEKTEQKTEQKKEEKSEREKDEDELTSSSVLEITEPEYSEMESHDKIDWVGGSTVVVVEKLFAKETLPENPPEEPPKEPEVEPSVEVTEDLFTKVDQDGVQIWPESDEYKQFLVEAEKEDFTELDNAKFLFLTGADKDGHPIVVLVGSRIPARSVSPKKLLQYVVHVLDKPVLKRYIFIWLAADQTRENLPKFAFLKDAYSLLPRKYKKNLFALAVVQPGTLVKLIFRFAKPFVSEKVWKKVSMHESFESLFELFPRNILNLPFDAIPKLPLFGSSLQDLASMGVSNENGVPIMVLDSITVLREKGLDTEGIFRIPGNGANIRAARDRINNHEKPIEVLSAIENVFDITSLFKAFLREMPDSLLSLALYPSLIAVTSDTSNTEDQYPVLLQPILANLPSENIETLRVVLDFVQEIVAHSETNKMAIDNLVLCLGPTLMWNPDCANPLLVLKDIGFVNSVIKTLFTHPEILPKKQ